MDDAINRISYGLYVLSVNCYKRDNGCIINTVMQVSESPNRICFSVSRQNHTCEMLDYADKVVVSVISEDADFSLFTHFGFKSGRDTEKFSGYEHCVRTENGALAVTRGTNAYICATVEERIDTGSHMLYIARVEKTEILSDTPSATYSYYHTHIKPVPKEKKRDNTVWRCKVCGYEYEGEELPEGYICPLCKHGADAFEKI